LAVRFPAERRDAVPGTSPLYTSSLIGRAAPYSLAASGDRLTGKKPTTALTGGSSYTTFGYPKPLPSSQPTYSERRFSQKIKAEKVEDIQIEIKLYQRPFDKPNMSSLVSVL
jgi:hypothetical protein